MNYSLIVERVFHQDKGTKFLSKLVWRKTLETSYISLFWVCFENRIVEFHVLYVLNMHINFRSNQILFTI